MAVPWLELGRQCNQLYCAVAFAPRVHDNSVHPMAVAIIIALDM
jgi:hypothetical protein